MGIHLYLFNYHIIMSDERKSEGDQEKKSFNQSKGQSQPIKTEEPSKFNFNSYHLNNIMNGNRQQHPQSNIPSQNFPPHTTQFNNFYMPNIFSSSNQYNSNDLQSLLNNMYVALSNQSRLLNYLVEKNEQNIQTTTKIYEEMISTKKQQTISNENIPKSHFKQANITSDITSNDLVTILYGPKTVFKYKLIMDQQVSLEKTLYRERNFKLKVNLIDDSNKLFPNSNKIPISLALYTVQNPPKFLESNTLGNKMLKGYTEQDLINGTCTFEKIQIKEVTSHYRKGMLFLVAFAKMPSFGYIADSFTVDYMQIHPLVIDKVIVKAKKSKEEGWKQGLKEKEKESDKLIYQQDGID